MAKSAFMLVVALLLTTSLLIVGCSSDNDEDMDATGDAGEVGILEFKANGEDFVRQGFMSKDGWAISFDHVYVNLESITAYQTEPPYDPHSEGATLEADVKSRLAGTHTVDLAEGDKDAEPIVVGTAETKAGQYNAISFGMVPASSGPAEGASLLIVGTAEKDGDTVDFTILIDKEYVYSCGEYVGDERKGFVPDGGTADVEMTFHFDHVFGDAEAAPDDHINVGATGFDSFAALAVDGILDIDMAGIEAGFSIENLQVLLDTLPTLGHVGEGHCHCE